MTNARAGRFNVVRAAGVAALLAVGLSWQSAVTRATALPDRLSDAEFWKLETDISEPGGYFRITDNYTSNEREVGELFTGLRERGVKGGVYLGVGPEQNLTYIAAIRPAMAFICDIRRQAVMQHLMFKAIFELSKDRADFISLLFSKPRPAGLDSTTPIQKMWEAYFTVSTDQGLSTKTYDRIVELLTKTHGFKFSEDESQQLREVFAAFSAFGPSITTRGSAVGGRGMGGNGMTFADLTGWATDGNGQPQSFLSTEDNFRTVKSLEDRNLVIPVSGDFGGPKAIRAIGAYLKAQGGVVSAFYVSNVEQYLFQDQKNREFYANVATLPVNDMSVFIRPYSMRRGSGGAMTSLCSIPSFIAAAGQGRVLSNNDALACVR
jgi:hypothetical protein